MKIIADENIPCLEMYFSSMGNLTKVSGRDLSREQLQDADVLLVRSVTPVNAELLVDTSVRFIGTATIGLDHLDVDHLNDQGIEWANAPGCNACSVMNYILSCFCRIDGLLERLFAGATVGIIGCGNVGGAVRESLNQLTIRTRVYDPYIDQSPEYMVSLEEVLSCDVVCLHTPLSYEAEHPSFHLLAEENLALLKHGAVLINAGRGAVIDNQALKQCLMLRSDLSVCLDVWEGEPAIDVELLPFLFMATPHIAGYSLDGKVAGTRMIYEACCRALKMTSKKYENNESLLPLKLDPDNSICDGLRSAVLAVYDVDDDNQRLREAFSQETDIGVAFDLLRRNYPERREFSRYFIENSQRLSQQLQCYLSVLGFVLNTSD